MSDYYDEKWLDSLEERFETIIKASQKARVINAGAKKDSNASPAEKVVVEALKKTIEADLPQEEKASEKQESPEEKSDDGEQNNG